MTNYFINPSPVQAGYCQCGDSEEDPDCGASAGFACLTPERMLVLACPYHAMEEGWVAKWCWCDVPYDKWKGPQ